MGRNPSRILQPDISAIINVFINDDEKHVKGSDRILTSKITPGEPEEFFGAGVTDYDYFSNNLVSSHYL